MTYQEIANKTSRLLTENTGWISSYSRYCKGIEDNKDYVKAVCGCICPKPPLTKYLSVGAVISAKNKVTIDLRIIGHSVATVTIKLDKEIKELIYSGSTETGKKVRERAQVKFKSKGLSAVKKNVTEDTAEYFDKGTEALTSKKNYSWESKELNKFRSNIQKCRFYTKSEHTVETLFLRELNKKSGKDKHLKMIQPCKICGQYYQLVTPLKASKAKNDELSYSKDKKDNDRKGGGIDILARIKLIEHNTSELCVIELKDKYESGEVPADAIKQAIAYAAFVIKLIRCGEAYGDKWYKLFGMNKNLTDKPIKINAVIAMPYNDKTDPDKLSEEDTGFAGKTVNVDGDIIELHYMYFKTEALKTAHIEKGITTSLKIPQSE